MDPNNKLLQIPEGSITGINGQDFGQSSDLPLPYRENEDKDCVPQTMHGHCSRTKVSAAQDQTQSSSVSRNLPTIPRMGNQALGI